MWYIMGLTKLIILFAVIKNFHAWYKLMYALFYQSFLLSRTDTVINGIEMQGQ